MAKRTSSGMFEDFFDKDYKFSRKLFDEKKAEMEDNIENIKIEIEESHKQKKGWFKVWLNELKASKEINAFSFMFDLF